MRMVEIEPLPHPLRDGVFEPDLGAEIGGEPGAVKHIRPRVNVARDFCRGAAGPEPSSLMASSAMASTTGLVSGPSKLSTACAIAFMPLAAETAAADRASVRIADRGRRQRRGTFAGDAVGATPMRQRAAISEPGISGDDGDVEVVSWRRRGLGEPDR